MKNSLCARAVENAIWFNGCFMFEAAQHAASTFRWLRVWVEKYYYASWRIMRECHRRQVDESLLTKKGRTQRHTNEQNEIN